MESFVTTQGEGRDEHHLDEVDEACNYGEILKSGHQDGAAHIPAFDRTLN